MDDVLNLLVELMREHGPVVLFLVAFIESAPLLGVLPGEVVLSAGGYFVQQGHLRGELAWIGVVLGVLLGDHLAYVLGRVGGPRILPRLPFQPAFRRAERLISRYGGLVVLLCRFSGVRAAILFTVGSMGLPYRTFLPYELVGAAVWSAWRLALGVLGGAALDRLGEYGPGYQALFIASLAVAAFLIWRNRDRLKVLARGAPNAG